MFLDTDQDGAKFATQISPLLIKKIQIFEKNKIKKSKGLCEFSERIKNLGATIFFKCFIKNESKIQFSFVKIQFLK